MIDEPLPLNLELLTDQLKKMEQTPTEPPFMPTPDAPEQGAVPVTDRAENLRRATLPEIYYDHQQKHYWMLDAHECWMQITEAGVARKLRTQGVSERTDEDGTASPMDRLLVKIQANNVVHYAAPLAGYDKGVHKILGRRILVTESPRLIEPVPGEWPLLSQILENMLNDQHDQRPYFLGWLKVAIESLQIGRAHV